MSDLSHILKDMNDQQREAITTDKGSYIVYAGARNRQNYSYCQTCYVLYCLKVFRLKNC
ncbi:MAG: hypothetical protein Ta2C_04910 [Candidatus Endomicrobiellum trichonymphae]|nr:MAG: hypothetical protein Ta2C_04910 [Candidatus Endomicrobium trichonymphae]